MALSGASNTNVGSHWRLRLEWSATQSTSNNTSTITARLFWQATSSWGRVNSSASKTCRINIGGSGNSRTSSGMASLSGNQKKEIHSWTRTVSHNSDGSLSVDLSAWFDLEVTLSGRYYGRVNVSTTANLNTIPRRSTLSSNANWTAGRNLSISISRASSSFTHRARIYVNNSLIKTITGIRSSATASFTQSENESIYRQLNGNSSRGTRVEITTYDSSGSSVGTHERTGTCTALSSSTLTTSRDFDIGDSMELRVNRADTALSHVVRVYVGGTLIHTQNFNLWRDWSPTSSQTNNMFSQTRNSNTVGTRFEVDTFYGSEQVRSTRSYTGTARVVDSDPSFSDDFTYRDINGTITTITGNSQYIVQDHSSVRVTITSSNRATARNGASMSHYVAILNGVERTASWSSSSTVTFDFGTISASSDTTLAIRAVDSRGNTTTASQRVTVLSYRRPVINLTLERLNNFEKLVTLKAQGTFSPLEVGGNNRNSLGTLRYRHKRTSDNTWGSWTSISYSTSGSSFEAPEEIFTLDNMRSWDFEVQLYDSISNRLLRRLVDVGQPILFVDSELNSLGMNYLPKHPNAFETVGNIYFHNPNNDENNTAIAWAGQTNNRDRDYFVIRSDRGGNSTGAGINLYSNKDRRFPGRLSLIFGTTGQFGGYMDDDSVRFRPFNDSHQSANWLKLQSAQKSGHSTNRYELSFIQRTGFNRTIYFDTDTSGTQLNLDISGDVYTKNMRLDYPGPGIGRVGFLEEDGRSVILIRSQQENFRGAAIYLYHENDSRFPGQLRMYGGGSRQVTIYDGYMEVHSQLVVNDGLPANSGIVLGNNNVINTYSGTLTIYGNRGEGHPFRVRSHDDLSDFRSDFVVDGDGDGRFLNDLQVDEHTYTRSVNHTGAWGDMYVRSAPGRAVRITDYTGTTTWRPIRASSFDVSSLEEHKTDIEKVRFSALEKVCDSVVYGYRRKDDVEYGIDSYKYGMVIGRETPNEVLSEDGESVDQYAMLSIAWKAIQELEDKVAYLEDKISKM